MQGTGSKQYVGGDGGIRLIAAPDRGHPVALEGTDLEGHQLSLAAMRGKPTVVTIWWAACPPCREEAPTLVAASKRLGSSANFVGIDIRDLGTAAPKAFVAHFGVPWSSFYSPGGKAMLAFTGTLSPNAVPATVVLDSRGRVAATIAGVVPSVLTLTEMVRSA